MSDDLYSQAGYEALSSYGDVPDQALGALRTEWQWGLLQQIIQPIIDAAVATTTDEQQQLQQIFRPLIKYGGSCVRNQDGWLAEIIHAMLMRARADIGMQTSEVTNLQQVFNQLKNTPESGQRDNKPSALDVASGPQKDSPSGLSSSSQGPNNAGQTIPISQTGSGVVLPLQPGNTGQANPQQIVLHLSQGNPANGQGSTIQSGNQSPSTSGGVAASGAGSGNVNVAGHGDFRDAGPTSATSPCPTIVINIPPCASKADTGSGADVPGKGGAGNKDEELPPEQPQFEPGKDPIVAAPDAKGGNVFEVPIAGMPVPSVTLFDVGSDDICAIVDMYRVSFAELGRSILGQYVSMIQGLQSQVANPAALAWEFNLPLAGGAGVRRIFDLSDIEKIVTAVTRIVGGQLTDGAMELLGIWAAKNIVATIDSLGMTGFAGGVVVNGSVSIKFEMTQLRRLLDYLENYALPFNIPNANETTQLWMNAEISDRVASCYWMLNGTSPVRMRQLGHAGRQQLDSFTTVREWFRYSRPWQDVEKELRGKGWLETDEMRRFQKSTEYIPGPADWIQWAVKEVFSTVDIGNAAVLAEFADQVGLREGFRLQGIVPINFVPQNPAPLKELISKHGKAVPALKVEEDGSINFDVPLAYWMAHYDHASPTQAYEMLHRLRPDRIKRYPLTEPNGKIVFPDPFSIDDLRGLLRINDYHPIWRDRLAAISYRPLGRIDVRRIYLTGGFGPTRGIAGFATNEKGENVPFGEAEKEIADQYKDQGYAEVDANRLAYFTAQEYSKAESSGRQKKAAAIACKSFKAGIIDRDRMFELLERVGISGEESAVIVANCETELEYETAMKGITSVRKMFLKAMIDASTANAYLAEIGVIAERRQRYISDWSIDLKSREKAIGAGELCKWLSEGLITVGEVEARLLRMGYSPTDARRVIRHCQIGELAKGQKQAEQRAKAEAKVKRATYAHRTEKQMILWHKKGLIHPTEVFDTLIYLGWTVKDAERWIRANLGVDINNRPIEEGEAEA